MLVHQQRVLTDIFPTAPCHGRIIAQDYKADQRDRLSLISQTSVGEVTSCDKDRPPHKILSGFRAAVAEVPATFKTKQLDVKI